MNNIWIATDWHLWNTEYDDGRHKFKSITRLGQLADEYTSVIGTNDLFIHLGDLCDPSNTKPEKLKAIIQSIPGTKILCRGNHDTESDEYYLAAGFDHVCEILVIHDLVFSHKPVNVGVDQINIHGHLHTRKLSTLDGRYLNAYDVNYSDKPILLEDLLQHAVQQTKADYADTEFKQDKVDKMFNSIENDHYENILDLSEEFSLDEQLIQETTLPKNLILTDNIFPMKSNNKYELICANQHQQLLSTNLSDIIKLLPTQAFAVDIFSGKYMNDKEYGKYIIDTTECAGDYIYSINDGEIIYTQSNLKLSDLKNVHKNSLFGNCVVIKHTPIMYSLYCHLDKVYVQIGDNVSKGSILGTCGSTGNSTGPHLHFQVSTVSPIKAIDMGISHQNTFLPARLINSIPTIFSNVKAYKEFSWKSDDYAGTDWKEIETKKILSSPAKYYIVRTDNTEYKKRISETSIAPMLHSLSATEIEKDEDPLDEVIFEDPEDTIYWEQDDIDPKLYKEKEPMAEAVSNNVLYHGSKNDMSIITPKNLSQNEDNYVFATPDYSFALCFAANRWDDSIINQSRYNGQLYLTELKPGAMEETFDTDGYIYEVSANKFTKYHNKSSEFISTKAVKPINKTYILNILDELNKNGVIISYYPHKPSWWNKIFNEFVLKSEPDIYWNKEKFDSGEINLCFITGLSGSGKSTMAHSSESDSVEVYEMDDLWSVKEHFTMDQLKEYGDLIYSYFNGPAKKLYLTFDEIKEKDMSSDDYEFKLYPGFIDYAIKYANSHKNKKYIIEGVSIFIYTTPEHLKDYAVYIKGTSQLKSFYRAAVRDSKDDNKIKQTKNFLRMILNLKRLKDYRRFDVMVNKFRDYYTKESEKLNENALTSYEEVTLTADHLAELHKAHPELSTILPDDGKDIHDPTKYYCSKAWIQDENVIAIASIRYPQANSEGYYSKLEHFYVNENHYNLYDKLYEHIMVDLGDNRLNESPTVWTNDPVDIYDRKYEILEEATKGSTKLYPVYVFLTCSSSWVSRTVKAVTKTEFTHSTVSFDPSLNTMYSFGNKLKNGGGVPGFSEESINHPWYKDDDLPFAVYVIFVNQAGYKRMQDRIKYFQKYGTKFIFDIPGLVFNYLNISYNPSHSYYCSRFVADIINAGSTKTNRYISDISFMRPQDFTETNFAYFAYSGITSEFDPKILKRETDRLLHTEMKKRNNPNYTTKQHYTIQRFQEAAATLSPATREDMNKLNAKWDLRPIGYGDRDKYIAEEEEKLRKMREHNRKIKEMKDKNKQRIKAEKQAKKARKLKVKNEEVHDPFNILNQDRFFDWNDYHNTILGENVYNIFGRDGLNKTKQSIQLQIDQQDNYKNGGAGVIKNLEDTISHYEKILDAMDRCEQHPDFKGPYNELPKPFNMMIDLKSVYKHNITRNDIENYIYWCEKTALPESRRKYEKWKRVNETSFKFELADKNFQFMNDINESVTGNNKLVPVFVVLTHSYSTVSRMVRAATGDEYTHASISFDSSLTNMYTFGRTADRSVFEGSFKIEDVSSDYYQKHDPPIPYGLFCVPVTEAEKKKMEKKIKYFSQNKDKFHFDFFGLFVNAMGIPNNPKNRYFCSRFVSEILNAGDPTNPRIKEPSLEHPNDFADEDFVRFVCSGENIALYDQVVADRIIKDIMRTEKLIRAQKSRVKNENFLGINSSDPFASDVLHYKFAMLDESGMDNFMRYLSSFKIQFDKEGNVIISRKEYDQLDKHFRESVRLCRTYSEAGNIEGIKEELAKVHYMVQLINKYYLSPNANKNPRMKSDIKKDMLDLRSVMLNHFNTYMKWITIREPQFNFQAYYDTSKYGNTNTVPAKVLTAVGKVLITAL